jgi:hypothetical protein
MTGTRWNRREPLLELAAGLLHELGLLGVALGARQDLFGGVSREAGGAVQPWQKRGDLRPALTRLREQFV